MAVKAMVVVRGCADGLMPGVAVTVIVAVVLLGLSVTCVGSTVMLLSLLVLAVMMVGPVMTNRGGTAKWIAALSLGDSCRLVGLTVMVIVRLLSLVMVTGMLLAVS